ncbi:hydroxysteroid dehydrogenase protein [Rutstroemia sp. NJR-2017a WRK4]|nr:hydroxysteroid dehydrogenase protein [Rutstroemia sp. NJR-2017a WRK4]
MESVLVIGGCGALGHRLVSELLRLDSPPHHVYVFDVRTENNRLEMFQYHNVDITSKDQVKATLRKLSPLPEVIIHTASPPPGLLDLELYIKVNVEGTRNLLECAEDLGVKAFVYTSSASVIHDAVSDLVEADETFPLVFLPTQQEIYSHTKALADQLVLEGNNPKKGFLTACIRPSGIFGENEPTARSLAENAAAGKLKYQIGNGRNLFDFTYVTNVIDAHILAAQALLRQHKTPVSDESLRVDGQGFVITNDEHILFWDFARGIGNAAGYPIRSEDVTKIPMFVALAMAIFAEWWVWIVSFGRKQSRMNRVGIRYSCMTRTYKIDKAKRVLGYRPRVSLQEGIRRAGSSFLEKDRKAE